MDRQEQTQRSHILEVSGTARPRDIQVRLKQTLISKLSILKTSGGCLIPVRYLSWEPILLNCLMLTQTRWVSDSGQKGAVVTLVELEEEGETNSWKGVSQEVISSCKILWLRHLTLQAFDWLNFDLRWLWRRWKPWKVNGNVKFSKKWTESSSSRWSWTGSSSSRWNRAMLSPYYSSTWVFHANS